MSHTIGDHNRAESRYLIEGRVGPKEVWRVLGVTGTPDEAERGRQWAEATGKKKWPRFEVRVQELAA